MRTTLFIFLFFTISYGLSQTSAYYHYPYPLYMGIRGEADSIVIKKYSVVPRTFGDSLWIREITDTRFFIFNSDGIIISSRLYSKEDRLLESILYEVQNKRISRIETILYKDQAERRNRRLIQQDLTEEIWIETYKTKNGYVNDTLKVSFTPESRVEKKITSSGSRSTEYSTYGSHGWIVYKKTVTDKRNISISYWDYDDNNFMIHSLSGSLISSIGTMAESLFFKYKTDERGNWIERRAYDKNGRLNYIEDRIMYYKCN